MLLSAAVVGAAELGRRRAGGRAAYESTAAMWALPWVLERVVCVWLAVLERARGGVTYRGVRVPQAASSAVTPHLRMDLEAFAAATSAQDGFATFMGIFRGPLDLAEEGFERLLFEQLRQLRELDDDAWDPRVSSDVADPRIGVRGAGRGFFIVGMHSGSSRVARRTPVPVVVFNPPWPVRPATQLRQLRAHA